MTNSCSLVIILFPFTSTEVWCSPEMTRPSHMIEGADKMIIQQVASVGAANILIVADDTYVFGPVSLCVKR